MLYIIVAWGSPLGTGRRKRKRLSFCEKLTFRFTNVTTDERFEIVMEVGHEAAPIIVI
jgi:hypothetical protein